MRAPLLVAAFLLLFLAPCQGADSRPWFPLNVARFWTFESDNATNTFYVQEWTQREWLLASFFNRDVRILARGQNIYVRHGRRASPLFLFSRGLNSPWRFRFSRGVCDQYEAEWVSTNATLFTRSGMFRECRVLSIRPVRPECGGASTGYGFSFREMTVYFVHRGGPVHITVDETVWMPSYREFTAPPRDAAVSLDTMGSTFTNLAYWGGCDGCIYPAPMTFTVTLSNRFEQPLCLDDQIDVEVNVVDEAGRLMTGWPIKPDVFPPMPQILFPGQARSWTGNLALIDRSGALLTNAFNVWASVRVKFLPQDAVDCSAPAAGWAVLGTEREIAVFIKPLYVGGIPYW